MVVSQWDDFGGLELTTSDTRPMGLNFLYRLASQLSQAKIQHDRSAISKGKEVPPLDEFVVQQMIDQYGMKDLAQSYLCEMYSGLAEHRNSSARLKLFAASTGLFPEEMILEPAQQTLLLEVLDSIADAMDAERALTQCRRDQLFLRWGEVNELFIPCRYALAGLQKAFEHEHPEVRDSLLPRLEEVINAATIPNVKECEKRAADKGVRACVLGKRLKASFIELDELLGQLVREHDAFVKGRQDKAHRVFAKFDVNGDGVFDIEEFRKMLETMGVEVKGDEIDDLWRAAGGKGTDAKSSIDMRALEGKLFSIGRLHKAATLKRLHKSFGKESLVEAAAAELAREELSVLVALWDSVRDAPESDKERIEQVNELMGSSWASVMRMKVWLRLRLERWRQAAKASAEARSAEA